jgi:hypothetical protein
LTVWSTTAFKIMKRMNPKLHAKPKCTKDKQLN